MKPDIKIPLNNQQSLEGLVTREFQSWVVLKAQNDSDVQDEIDQCESNFNNLLDHYPAGLPRPEVSIEQANEAILRLGQRAVAA
jgi:hypothetical protein